MAQSAGRATLWGRALGHPAPCPEGFWRASVCATCVAGAGATVTCAAMVSSDAGRLSLVCHVLLAFQPVASVVFCHDVIGVCNR